MNSTRKIKKKTIVLLYIVIMLISTVTCIYCTYPYFENFPFSLFTIDLSENSVRYLNIGVFQIEFIARAFTFISLCMCIFLYFYYRNEKYRKLKFIYICLFLLMFIVCNFICKYWSSDLTYTYVKIGSVMNSILFWHYPIGSILFYTPLLISFDLFEVRK